MLSLTARGVMTGEIAAHFEEVYAAKVSRATISRITGKVVEEMTKTSPPQPTTGPYTDEASRHGQPVPRAPHHRIP
jgi:transposase-like protein